MAAILSRGDGLITDCCTFAYCARSTNKTKVSYRQDIFIVCVQGPLLLRWFNFNPNMVSNHVRNRVKDDIMCPFPNFNGAPVEVRKWINNFIPHFGEHAITYHAGIKVTLS